MQWSLPALMAISLLVGIDMAPAIAGPVGDFPFCIHGDTFAGAGSHGDCSFTSYAQCQATASGLAASCSSNPYYGNAEAPPAGGRSSRRRH